MIVTPAKRIRGRHKLKDLVTRIPENYQSKCHVEPAWLLPAYTGRALHHVLDITLCIGLIWPRLLSLHSGFLQTPPRIDALAFGYYF